MTLPSALLAVSLCLAASAAHAHKAAAIVESYADIALAAYEDSLATARSLQTAVEALVESPSAETLTTAREAWLAARAPYQQTEAFRFGNPIVDAWEGRVNAWPLDEGLIDYVDKSYGEHPGENDFYAVNIIANQKVSVGGATIDASAITPALLRSLHELGGIEANVATGYHAIEFLLWGQDLNGTAKGAGARPYSDFDVRHCTGGNCQRRARYLKTVTELLVADLEEMAAKWREDGEARTELEQGGFKKGLAAMLTGIASLSYGELAGERIKLGLLLHDPEEEHDCFSDNTHNSHYYDVLGISNVYFGRYRRTSGALVEGASIAALLRERNPSLARHTEAKLAATLDAAGALKTRAETVEAYDQMIAEGNEKGNAVVAALAARLIDQTHAFERVIGELDLSGVAIEGSDSLSDPKAVFR